MDTTRREGRDGCDVEDQHSPPVDGSNQCSLLARRPSPNTKDDSSAQNNILFLGQDPYLYECFRLSILMAILFTCVMVGFLLWFSYADYITVWSFNGMLGIVAILVFCVALWLLCFVLVELARFSNTESHPSAITSHTMRQNAVWRRSAGYVFFVVILLGGMFAVTSLAGGIWPWPY